MQKCLARHTELRRLSLRDNSVSDRGAQALAQVMASGATSLEELDLWGNCISEQGKALLLRAATCEVFLEPPVAVAPRGCGSVAGGGAVHPRLRTILFDWISQIHTGINVAAALEAAPDPQDMLFRTFVHLDAFLAACPVPRAELQLVGVACTLVATRVSPDMDGLERPEYQELAGWLSMVTDDAFDTPAVCEAASRIRQVLGSKMHQPTPYTFLRRCLRRTGWTEKSFGLANYLLELAALDGSFREWRPQTLAAAASILSRQYFSQGVSINHTPHWKAKLLKCAQVDLKTELAPCTAALSRLHAAQSGRSSSVFVNKKYEWPRLHRVAKLRPNPPRDASFFVCYMGVEAGP